jgi:hypothetical protein
MVAQMCQKSANNVTVLMHGHFTTDFISLKYHSLLLFSSQMRKKCAKCANVPILMDFAHAWLLKCAKNLPTM